MQDKSITHGLWALTAPPPPDLSPLEGDTRAAVALVGGGYTGLSAALHLAEAGADVVLLEAEEIGFGGAGRNVGLVNAGLWLMPDDVVKLVGAEHGERLVEELGTSPDLVYDLIERHGISCEAVRRGTLHCAHSRAGLRALEQREVQWRRRGAPVTLLDRKEAAGKLGTDTFHGALLDRRAGTLQPLAYANGLAHAAKDAGARLHIASPVTSVERIGARWRLTTPGGLVEAESVIQATHAYPTGAFRDDVKNLIPFNFFQFSTPPLPESLRDAILPERHGAWDTALILSSYRIDAAGRLVVGSVGRVDAGGYGLNRAWALRTLRNAFPQLGAVSFEHAWYGRIAMTVDHVPRLHVPGPGYTVITSYNGRGIGPGTLFGKRLAEHALGAPLETLPLPVSPKRPVLTRGLRGLFYEAGSRAYHFVQRRF
jgi:glycine/D-amino acid oxidase-like deaminating enzyme